MDAAPVYLRDAAKLLTRIEPGRESFIGRDARCEVVVPDPAIEWRHAMVVVEGAGLRVLAVGQEGATFVDGVRVGADLATSALARSGSEILIVTHPLVLETGDGVAKEYERTRAQQQERRNVQLPRTMSGSIEEVPLPDLLALVETSKKSGVLVLRREDDVVARIFLEKGLIIHVALDELEAAKPSLARAMMMEVLGWKRAVYDLDPPADSPPHTVSLRGTELVLEFNAMKARR